MNILIGRKPEIEILQEALNSNQAELITLYGRRRVGKTYLIRTVYEKEILLELTGAIQASNESQLENFYLALSQAFGLPYGLMPPQNWVQSFHVLRQLLEPVLASSNTKKVIFIDELPWLDKHKSGFLSAFDYFWNNWASKQQNLVVVICGSAASWMIQNIVNNKGGLHNRLTRRIRLLPFNLYETEQFLKNQYSNLDRYQILQLYMATGGIPHYLKEVKRGESVAQTIDRLCFTKDGLLADEFKNLYTALFGSSEKHENIVKALANKPNGMTRNEIVETCKIPSGGGLTKLLEELSESGFIAEYIPFGKSLKDSLLKLSDEFSLFHLKFMGKSKSFGKGTWQTKSAGIAWRSWTGLAFENICMKHIVQIKKALGISAVYTEQSAWRYTPKNENEQGTQIDLLIDRQDNCINICEMKYASTEFTIDKSYSEKLFHKKQIFLEKTASRKTIFMTMISSYGVKQNDYYLNYIQNQLTIDVLFEDN